MTTEQPHPNRGLPHLLEKLESAIGAFFASIMVVWIGAMTPMIFLVAGDAPPWAYALMLVLTLCWLVLDIPYAIRLWRCLWVGLHPITVQAAMRSRRPRNWILRIPIAIWWAVHFLYGIGFVLLMETYNRTPQKGSDQTPPPDGFHFIMVFALIYVANGFMILALETAGASERTLRTIWRYRLLVDFAITVAAMLIRRAYPD